jgi:thioredoxin-related protein
MRTRILRAIIIAVATFAAGSSSATSHGSTLGYDPKADPFEQYQDAVTQATAQHKLVLVIAGGDWCRWCHVLNRFVTRNADVDAALHDAFVVVKVYVGDENYNEFFFSQLPQARGAPHFWIISPDRSVLDSQSTGPFEHGRDGYDKTEFLQFVEKWKQK